jgi:hypothetical protein
MGTEKNSLSFDRPAGPLFRAGQAEIDWDQLGHSSYDRAHAEL